MATLDSLKQALEHEFNAADLSAKIPLSDKQYSNGFKILARGLGWQTYQDFTLPQLSILLAPLFNSLESVSVLEIGPGPKTVLGYLPEDQKRKIKRYTAYEPHSEFTRTLRASLSSNEERDSALPSTVQLPIIHQKPFVVDKDVRNGLSHVMSDNKESYDIILFCHSMYGMGSKRKVIDRALRMLGKGPGRMVVAFHRDINLDLEGLVCHRVATFPQGAVSVENDDEVLDCFASFIAGSNLQDCGVESGIQHRWRKVCRDLGRRAEDSVGELCFNAPEIMMAFTKNATALPKLIAEVPLVERVRTIKNREARLRHPAAVVRPESIQQVQQCVQWALKYKVGLTVIGGGHGGHCLQSNVVAVDMSAFGEMHIIKGGQYKERKSCEADSLLVVETGCTTKDIISYTMTAGLTVPLGSRPSVGAGLWLQGGIGHLSRLHGLACDSIIGAIMVSINSGQIICVGYVPKQHCPTGAVRPKNEDDILWAIKGAGTNFGIVLRVVFKTYVAPTYLTRSWVVPMSNVEEALLRLSDFSNLAAGKLNRHCSADAYLYWESDRLHLGVTMFESFLTREPFITTSPTFLDVGWGEAKRFNSVDGVELFDAEMYVSEMHGGHAGGKTSSFKRCLFLKNIEKACIASRLVEAVKDLPSPMCYLHLLQGGGAISDVEAGDTAFGCRDWDFACIITGVWPRDQDGTEAARLATQWVYNVAEDLLPISSGAYGADLGPDLRDTALAARAFGPNQPRLVTLKKAMDPQNILSYTCPFQGTPMVPKLIILVTGESCAGKDYCAEVWAATFNQRTSKALTASRVSISDATKREYALKTGADLSLLLSDRGYKEQHRPALTAFFETQVQERPQIREEHFLNIVYGAIDVDILLITGMRDEAPVATFSSLVPDSRLLEVHVHASQHTRRTRKGQLGNEEDSSYTEDSTHSQASWTSLVHCPSFIFDNNVIGREEIQKFAERHLFQYIHENLQRLSDMIRKVPDFPRVGLDFCHILGIPQHKDGLALSTSLLKTHFTGDWAKIDAIVSCEAGGFVFAPALALQVNVALVLIREAGRLPPPTVSVSKTRSHISSFATCNREDEYVEMEQDAIPLGASVVVLDDVLATGETICAMLRLLKKAGVDAEHISVMVVAEFPAHGGRELLRKCGFGKVQIQSLLVFGGA